MIQPIDPARDAEAITSIYRPFVTDTDISFEREDEPPTADEMRQRLESFLGEFPGFLWREPDGTVVGYCYAHPWKERAAYNPTLETTVYINPAYARRGIGRKLMEALIDECRRRGTVSLIACITAGNEASCALHAALGFRQVSYFSAVGRKFGRWLDVVDYQLLLRPVSSGLDTPEIIFDTNHSTHR